MYASFKGPALVLQLTLLACFLSPAGLYGEACDSFLFEDVSAGAGLTFRHERGALGEKHFTEPMGSGLAWLDYDGDGWQDLFLVQSGPFPPSGLRSPGQLYRNLGNGKFRAVGGVDTTAGYGQGVVATDVDGDGEVDLYLTNFGADVFLLNDGRGGFADATSTWGLGLDGWSSSAAFADADLDGDLDLYVARYVQYDVDEGLICTDSGSGERVYCDPSLFVGETDAFYENEGVIFQNVGAERGFGDATGRGLGVLFIDLDRDRLPEVYVANDLTMNLLFQNLGRGTFEDISLLSGTAVNRDGKPEAGMGVATADVDRDGTPDLVVTNFDVETNTLYMNLGDLFFSDVSAASGFGPPSFNYLAFGIVVEDFNGDGSADVYVANGHIFERPHRDSVDYKQPDFLLLGGGDGRFNPAPCGISSNAATVSRGAASADYDNDGDPDIAVQENAGPARLLRNTRPASRWMGVVLRGQPPNTQAVGARLTWADRQGAASDWQTAGDSYQSSSDVRRLFAGVNETEGSLEVHWPCGGAVRLMHPPRDRYLVIDEGGFNCGAKASVQRAE